ncbi:DUF2442 domain-containing protein [Tepidimonas taiwanensis]|uniref:DUF2442 domain-containing protein n=1 Tax=Tepidimonas taiwanensis TaxID=307486 RepID=A0A554X561_9BURK|nr:DUF2442 domain-containing protein [Tepidimonas taiwanensis]MCX7692531.1 DUF2442 domain-containing protein [Tepidimonas taiwanensis]MDM7463321.1 DUF2442 domain-containing protein [Tepidimonas taiwanensis]TSE30972.1 hypothetical protein Ttaiw_01721 [Tepidimonas taiwanensis]UBQ05819.1 DUF2442 domain-containing protein [Tepidimonas taiwanensis]
MREQAAAETDLAIGLTPCPPPVVAVCAVRPGVLEVRFADGLSGEVEIQPSHLTGVFASLKDAAVFAQVRVEDGAVTWPNGVDLAPDAMYEALAREGRWVLA